jgi:hypothetical protein
VPLIVSSNKLKDIATKNYHLLKFYSYLDAIDYDKSSFETLKKEDGTVESVNGVPWITKFEKLVLKEDVITGKDLFCLNSAIFGRNLFCSENFKSVAEKMKMYGLLFIPYEEAADFINFNGFLGPATYDRHKSFQQKK